MAMKTGKGLAQRKETTHRYNKDNPLNTTTLLARLTYGVPAPRRMLSISLLYKKHDLIRSYLVMLGLTSAEREIAFHLLRLYAYYGRVYPKAHAFTGTGGCSKRSFWRAVAKLEDSGLIDRINRYLHHLQISNCYRLDKFILCICRYLAEHGHPFLDHFTQTIIRQTATSFWRILNTLKVRLRDPIPLSKMS